MSNVYHVLGDRANWCRISDIDQTSQYASLCDMGHVYTNYESEMHWYITSTTDVDTGESLLSDFNILGQIITISPLKHRAHKIYIFEIAAHPSDPTTYIFFGLWR